MAVLAFRAYKCYHLRGSFEGEFPCGLNVEHQVTSIQILHHKEQVGLHQMETGLQRVKLTYIPPNCTAYIHCVPYA